MNRLIAALVLALMTCGPAGAQASGFYRLMVGGLEVTALNDGTVPYATHDVLPTASAQQIADYLRDNALTDPVGMSYNAFLINSGKKLILIDTGTGGKLDDSPFFHGAGRLLANLRSAGYRPEQIDEIYITHRGQDHVGGLSLDAKATFPNALLRVPRLEFEVVVDPEKAKALIERAHGSEFVKGWIKFAQDAFAPYIAAGRFELIEDDATFPSGVRAISTPGHTPGHMVYVIKGRGERLILAGDLVLSPLQFAEPSLISNFDSDPAAATAQRVRILKIAASPGSWVAGGHIPFPGIGHILNNGSGFMFVPPAN